MAANQQEIPYQATEAESLAQLAAQIGDLTALLKRENDGRLSAGEIALIPEANARAERKERPVGELDATLIVGDLKLTFGLSVYGRLQPHMAGDREQPEEREFIEIDRVILSSGPDAKCDIYDALSWADLQNISDAILEAGE